MGKLLSQLLVCGVVLLPVAGGAQSVDGLSRQRIEAAVDRLSDPAAAATLAEDAGAMMTGMGLAWPTTDAAQAEVPAFVPGAGAVIELVNIRLLLAQIAIQTGARDHVALVRAQGARDHGVILLRGGLVTLADLVALSRGTPAQEFVTATPEGVVLTRPLAIWSDAGLAIAGQDQLVLDRPSGAFVANLGRLDLSGGAIRGSAAPNVAEDAFRPFVMTAGQGSFTARGATFRALGFGDVAVFGGISVANNGLVTPPFASSIADSLLDDVRTVGLIGTTGAILTGNRIVGSAGAAVVVSKARATQVVGNRLTGTTGTQAIRVTAGATGVRISGNLLSGAARTGILVDRDSRDVSITGNLVAGHLTTGIGVADAACVGITGNLVAGNGGNGISLTDSEDATIGANAIVHNHGSGVLVRDQSEAARVQVTGNVLAGNRNGLRGATVGDATVAGNDLDGQVPSLFAGDFALLAVDWLRNRRDGVPVVRTAAPAMVCVLAGEG